VYYCPHSKEGESAMNNVAYIQEGRDM